PAIGGHLADGVLPARKELPEGGGIGRAGEAAAQANDGDRFALGAGPLQAADLGAQFSDLQNRLLHQGLFVERLGRSHGGLASSGLPSSRASSAAISSRLRPSSAASPGRSAPGAGPGSCRRPLRTSSRWAVRVATSG